MRLNRENIATPDTSCEQEDYSSQYSSEAFSYYKKATTTEVFNEALSALVHQKALDLKALDIGAISDIADTLIIVSGTSQRHVRGIADKVKEKLLKLGEGAVSVSGYEQGDWVILDYADLIIHVFYEPMRQYYALDEMWSKQAVEIYPDPELAKEIRKLRTGISW